VEAARRNQIQDRRVVQRAAAQGEQTASSHILLVGRQILTILEFAEENDWPEIQPFQVITGYVRRKPRTTEGAGWLLSHASVGSDRDSAYQHRILLSTGDIAHGQSSGYTPPTMVNPQSFESLLASQGHTSGTEHRLDADLRNLANKIGAQVIIP
jgi:hypothetical protein